MTTNLPLLKLPRKPLVPVAQNVQPMAHPTCEETHRVARVPWRMITASTLSPSCKFTRSLVVDLSISHSCIVVENEIATAVRQSQRQASM